MRTTKTALYFGWFFAALTAVAGCGGSGSMARVSGTVTLDGELVETGAIMFLPVDGSTQTTGGEITDGRYSVQVPLGLMKVSISAPKVVGTKKLYDTPDSPEMPVTAEAIPVQYNEQTELQIEVTAGENQKDFELRSK